jgi:GNAT superfamily N-acetyltransferase
MTAITFRLGNDLELDAVIELYSATTLGVRRPLEDRAAMADMLKHANLVVTAWDGPILVGIARSLTDFSYVAYLSDLAVRDSHQRRGIGRDLIQQTRDQLGPRCKLVLLSAPLAVDYYPRHGFTQHPSAWTLDAHEPLL